MPLIIFIRLGTGTTNMWFGKNCFVGSKPSPFTWSNIKKVTKLLMTKTNHKMNSHISGELCQIRERPFDFRGAGND